MQTEIGKWGNSLALRIPSKMAKEIGFVEGMPATMEAVGGKLVATPVLRKHSWDEIMESLERAGRQEEISSGPEVGREVVEW